MSIVTFVHKGGDFSKTKRFFEKLKEAARLKILEKYAQMGVSALSAATPVDTGLTAGSWTYEIENSNGSAVIRFLNTHVNKGVNIAIILQYGHGTRNGGYVQGRDYINPATKSAFDKMVADLWKEVTSV